MIHASTDPNAILLAEQISLAILVAARDKI
jgi:hypothetical protein